MLVRVLILILLVVSFVVAVDVEFSCPDEIVSGEEFECDVGVFDGSGVYDLKVEADSERDSVLRIWDGEVWKSGYYYVNDFIREDEIVKLKILEEGRYDVVLKLRQDEYRAEFEVGKLKVDEALESEEEEILDKNSEDSVEKGEIISFSENEVISLTGNEVIPLTGNVVGDKEEWDYVSKDGMVVDWLPYLFCLFLIFLVGILLWDKF